MGFGLQILAESLTPYFLEILKKNRSCSRLHQRVHLKNESIILSFANNPHGFIKSSHKSILVILKIVGPLKQ